MKVLVVDDDVAGRYLLESMLRSHGYEVATACDGIEALETARHETIDLLVTDVLMPRMDGYQLCRTWKSDPALADKPVVFYTATYTQPADEAFAVDVGADMFLRKPAEPKMLFAAIDEVAHRTAVEGAGSPAKPVLDENQVLREYNERLVTKLEQKLEELSDANEVLSQASEALEAEMHAKNLLVEQLGEDIRRRRRAEEDLAASNELLQTVLAGSPLAIIAVDAEGMVMAWNQAAETLFGWTEREAIGVPLSILVRTDAERLLDLAAQGGGCSGVERLTARGGRLVEADLCMGPLVGPAGAPAGFVAIMSDLTERRQLDELKQQFVQMVGHELRTPLTSIVGYGDLLGQIDPATDPETARRLVAHIRQQGDVMHRLVEDLLVVLQVQSEGLRLEVGAVDLTALCRDRIAAMRPDPRHDFVLEAPDTPVVVCGDPAMLGLALHNVLANAVKYTPDGGPVLVAVSAAESEGAIRVVDKGVGISPEAMPHIFELFRQADMSTTRSFGGLGMGLYLTKRILEAHGGRVDAASIPGEGAAFTLTMPLAQGL
jgi:PAS domain S-box-containing protein